MLSSFRLLGSSPIEMFIRTLAFDINNDSDDNDNDDDEYDTIIIFSINSKLERKKTSTSIKYLCAFFERFSAPPKIFLLAQKSAKWKRFVQNKLAFFPSALPFAKLRNSTRGLRANEENKL